LVDRVNQNARKKMRAIASSMFSMRFLLFFIRMVSSELTFLFVGWYLSHTYNARVKPKWYSSVTKLFFHVSSPFKNTMQSQEIIAEAKIE
jgi:uncharacterized membrane protein (DUF106 family)